MIQTVSRKREVIRKDEAYAGRRSDLFNTRDTCTTGSDGPSFNTLNGAVFSFAGLFFTGRDDNPPFAGKTSSFTTGLSSSANPE
jgi:hypothetical protein